MVKKRQLRIVIFYSSIIAIMIIVIWIFKVTGFMNKYTGRIYNTFAEVLMAFLIITPIACLGGIIYHVIFAFNLSKKNDDKKIYMIWEYDKNLWRNFIRIYFKTIVSDDIKSIILFGFKFLALSSGVLAIGFVANPKYLEHALIYIFIPFGIFILYLLWVMGRNVLKAIDHLIFTDYKIAFFLEGIIFNGEYINWEAIGESELVKRKINDGFIEISYAVSSRSSGRNDNRFYLSVKDVKRIRIPIPKGKLNDAIKYVRLLCPINRL